MAEFHAWRTQNVLQPLLATGRWDYFDESFVAVRMGTTVAVVLSDVSIAS